MTGVWLRERYRLRRALDEESASDAFYAVARHRS